MARRHNGELELPFHKYKFCIYREYAAKFAPIFPAYFGGKYILYNLECNLNYEQIRIRFPKKFTAARLRKTLGNGKP